VRMLLRGLGDEGRTVFVSSHILSEVQAMCDRVAILARGRCVTSGPVDDVLSAGGPQGLIVKVADLAAGLAVLHRAGIPAAMDGTAIRVELPPAEAERVSRELATAGLYVTELRPQELSLETVFLELTGS